MVFAVAGRVDQPHSHVRVWGGLFPLPARIVVAVRRACADAASESRSRSRRTYHVFSALDAAGIDAVRFGPARVLCRRSCASVLRLFGSNQAPLARCLLVYA